MAKQILASLRRLSDAELLARVTDLAARERDAMAELIAHLAELDTRDVHLRAGYGSLFVYCRDALALPEHEAYSCVGVARAARRFPVILEMLAQGAMNLTTARLLAPHLTPDNHQRVLESARGKRKIEVEEIAARLAPQPDVRAFIRKLPALRPAFLPPAVPLPVVPPPVVPPDVTAPAVPILAPPQPAPAAAVVPLAPYRYKLQVTIDGDILEKLRLAKDMLRHAIPSGNDAVILDRALSSLLADLARKKFAATETPRPFPGAAPGSRHIPAEVKRAVWLRDLGRCAFVGDGRRCSERGFVEFHHVKPYALGGAATVENIQLRCRRHNDYEARVYFGRGSPNGDGDLVREQAPPYGVTDRPFREA